MARFFLFPGRQFDFAETLISFDVTRIECDGSVGVIDGLVGFLEILRIDKGELEIRIRLIGIGFDRVFQDIDRLRKIVLPCQQSGHTRCQLGLAWIDVEHFAIRLQRVVYLAVFFERRSFDKMSECIGLALALRAEGEVLGRRDV